MQHYVPYRISHNTDTTHSCIHPSKDGTELAKAEKDVSLDALPRPLWMETLIHKFIQDFILVSASHSGEAIKVSQVKQYAPSLGEFACFLSCCLTKLIPCTDSESECLYEVSCFPQ